MAHVYLEIVLLLEEETVQEAVQALSAEHPEVAFRWTGSYNQTAEILAEGAFEHLEAAIRGIYRNGDPEIYLAEIH